MLWHGLLKSILPENFIKISPQILDSLEEVHIASDNTTNPQTIYNNGTLIIINSGEYNEGPKLLKQVKVDQLVKGDTVLETGSAKKLQEVNDNFWTEPIQKSIAQYGSMVPGKDYHILESAIYIQTLYDSGQKVGEYMRDINIRYGSRGSMICHLYSAGYFDTLIGPIYQELMQNDNPQVDQYNAVYELIVTESPLALFISRRDEVHDIEEKVIKRIELNQNAGVHYLHIHGIGRDNRTRIERALRSESLKELLIGDPEYETKNGMTTITIYFS
jgi:hypothetical protein